MVFNDFYKGMPKSAVEEYASKIGTSRFVFMGNKGGLKCYSLKFLDMKKEYNIFGDYHYEVNNNKDYCYFYFDALQKNKQCEVACICDIAPQARELARKLAPNAKVVADEQEVFDLTDPAEYDAFLTDDSPEVTVPFSDRQVPYLKDKKTGIALSSIGANRAIAAGAYAFALSRLDDNAHNRF